MEELLHQRLARQIVAELLSSEELLRLPSHRSMAAHFGVSRTTIAHAIDLLEKKGLVRRSETGKVYKAGHSVPRRPVTPVYDRLCGSIRRKVISGGFRVGTALPKIEYYTRTLHTGTHTVLRVYRTLLEHKLVHKSGKRYIVGPDPAAGPAVLVRSRPVIILCMNRNSSWRSYNHSQRVGSFTAAFMHEAERMGIELVPLAAGREGSGETTLRLMHSLDTKLAGTLITLDRFEAADIEHWARLFARARRGVVWFDRNDDGWEPEVPTKLRGIYRCCSSESRTVIAALAHLYEQGHRRCLFAATEAVDWQERRGRALASAAKGFSGLTVKTYLSLQSDDWKATAGHRKTRERIHRVAAVIPPHLSDNLDYFVTNRQRLLRRYGFDGPAGLSEDRFDGLAATARTFARDRDNVAAKDAARLAPLFSPIQLLPCLEDRSITAIISPNDATARRSHLKALGVLGIKVPEHMSIISFDNAYPDEFFPLTTVDFGFDYLGYQAFHAIIGDIPVAANRRNDIMALPRVIDRGSVGHCDVPDPRVMGSA